MRIIFNFILLMVRVSTLPKLLSYHDWPVYLASQKLEIGKPGSVDPGLHLLETTPTPIPS
jgi:hypothetical protein